jgi:hypothetical protein
MVTLDMLLCLEKWIFGFGKCVEKWHGCCVRVSVSFDEVEEDVSW